MYFDERGPGKYRTSKTRGLAMNPVQTAQRGGQK